MTTPTAPEPQHAAQRHYQPSPMPEPRSYPFDDDHARMSDPSSTLPSSAVPDKTAAGVLVWRVVSFVVGCALLVWCAWALGDTIPRWSREYGRVLVFLLFFIVMSIGGRWFWMGIDAAMGRVIGGRQR